MVWRRSVFFGSDLTATLIPIALGVVVAAHWPVNCQAAEPGATLSGIQVSDQGDIVLEVEGDGFDPLLETRPLADGQYQITISGKHVLLGDLPEQVLSASLHKQVPAIHDCMLSGNQNGFQINLTSWQRLQPQIKSNSGNRIMITLIGDHQLPAAVIARKQHEAEQKRQAEAQREADRLAQQKVALAKQQAEETARRQKLEAQKRAEVAAQLAAAKKRTEEAKQHRLPSATSGGVALDTDWQTAYRHTDPVAFQATDEDTDKAPVQNNDGNAGKKQANHYDLAFPRALSQPFTPKMLAKDRIPASAFQTQEASKDADDGVPFTPLHLQKTPVGYDPDATTTTGQSHDMQPDSGLYSEYAVSSEPVIQRAWDSLHNGRTDSAELDLRNYLARNPDNVEARYLLALALDQSARVDSPDSKAIDRVQRESARQELLKIVSKRPFLPAYLKLTDWALDEGKSTEAERLLEKITPLYPQEAMVWFLQGRLNEANNKPAEAKTAYLNALTLNPRQPEFHYRLAQAHLKTDDWDACRWELLQALAISPDDARCWKLLGYLAEKQGKPEQAAQWYKASLQPDVMIHYGRLLEKRNQPKQAMAIYQAVESIAGEDVDLLFNLGLIYVDAKQTQRAEAVLKRFIKLDDKPDDARIAQARILLKQLKR